MVDLLEIPFYELSIEETLKTLESNSKTGLSNEEVEQRLKQYGLNELDVQKAKGFTNFLQMQLEDTLVRFLFFTAFISLIITQFDDYQTNSAISTIAEPIIIFALIFIKIFCYSYWQAEGTVNIQKKSQSLETNTLRNGKWVKVSTKDLVPGDIIKVITGDKVPADCRVIEIPQSLVLKVDQFVLTEESKLAKKSSDRVIFKGQQGHPSLLDQTNILFSGTVIISGAATCIVCLTGKVTQLGRIEVELQEALKKKNQDKAPLSSRIEDFSDVLAKITAYMCIICWAMNIQTFSDPIYSSWIKGAIYYLKDAITLVDAAIPVALPLVMTLHFSVGIKRLSTQNVIIKNLGTLETLGYSNIICTDKTGTVTYNEMCPDKFCIVNAENPSELKNFQVDGYDLIAHGKIIGLQEYIGFNLPVNLKYFCECIALCSEASLSFDANQEHIIKEGPPQDAGLKILNETIGHSYSDFINNVFKQNSPQFEQFSKYMCQNYEKLISEHYSRDKKVHACIVKDKETNNNLMFVTGAPEYLLKRATKVMTKSGQIVELDQESRKAFLYGIHQMAEGGLRVEGICMREDKEGELSKLQQSLKQISQIQIESPQPSHKLDKDLVYLGFVGLINPPRPEIKNAVEQCYEAGISVIMITSDKKESAEVIAKQCSIITEGQQFGRSYTVQEFNELTEYQQYKALGKIIAKPGGFIFSRYEIKFKRYLVSLLIKKKQIVSITGDSVNHAAALKRASVGISMGITGTQVAIESSDMIIQDDNFATIVNSIAESRKFQVNMKTYIKYLLTSNIAGVVNIFIGSMIGVPYVFTSIQLIWVNLIINMLPAMALAYNPADSKLMKKPPTKKSEINQILDSQQLFRCIIVGFYIGISTIITFAYWYVGYDWSNDGHQLIKFGQLKHWTKCPQWVDFKIKNFDNFDFTNDSCLYFQQGIQKASSVCLSVLVTSILLVALNSINNRGFLIFKMGFFQNFKVIFAIIVSFGLHLMICNFSLFRSIFHTVPLDQTDWKLVLAVSLPTMIIDDLIRFIEPLFHFQNKKIKDKVKIGDLDQKQKSD